MCLTTDFVVNSFVLHFTAITDDGFELHFQVGVLTDLY